MKNEASTVKLYFFLKEECGVGALETGFCFQPGLLVFLMFFFIPGRYFGGRFSGVGVDFLLYPSMVFIY